MKREIDKLQQEYDISKHLKLRKALDRLIRLSLQAAKDRGRNNCIFCNESLERGWICPKHRAEYHLGKDKSRTKSKKKKNYPAKECMLCGKRVAYSRWVCKSCRKYHELPEKYKDWPEEYKEAKRMAEKWYREECKRYDIEITSSDINPDLPIGEALDLAAHNNITFGGLEYQRVNSNNESIMAGINSTITKYRITQEQYEIITAGRGELVRIAKRLKISYNAVKQRKKRLKKRLILEGKK